MIAVILEKFFTYFTALNETSRPIGAARMTHIIGGGAWPRYIAIEAGIDTMQPTTGFAPRWLLRLRRRLKQWLRAGPPDLPAPYPDYVACPHCGEPEVEVWCNQPEARCHNCGQTFAHPVPADCEPGPEP